MIAEASCGVALHIFTQIGMQEWVRSNPLWGGRAKATHQRSTEPAKPDIHGQGIEG